MGGGGEAEAATWDECTGTATAVAIGKSAVAVQGKKDYECIHVDQY